MIFYHAYPFRYFPTEKGAEILKMGKANKNWAMCKWGRYEPSADNQGNTNFQFCICVRVARGQHPKNPLPFAT